MKKLLFSSILLSGLLSSQTYSNTTSVAIPDNSTSGVTSTINVPITTNITDPSKITFNFGLVHTWAGDLTIALVPPGGTETGAIALLKRMINSGSTSTAGSSANFVAANVIGFNSAASGKLIGLSTWSSSTQIPAGVFLPTAGGTNTTPTDYSEANLITLLNGKAVNGDWKIKVFDSATGDTGSVNNWQIVFDSGSLGVGNTQIVATPYLTLLQNPVKDAVELKISQSKNLSVAIYSTDGKLLYDQNLGKIYSERLSIPAQKWEAGTYILVPVVDGKKQLPIKIIKN